MRFISPSRTTLTNTKLYQAATVLSSYHVPTSSLFNPHHRQPPRSTLRYKTHSMLGRQVASMPVYLRLRSCSLRGESNPAPKFSQLYSCLPCPACHCLSYLFIYISTWVIPQPARATVQVSSADLLSSLYHPLISAFHSLTSATLNHATQDYAPKTRAPRQY